MNTGERLKQWMEVEGRKHSWLAKQCNVAPSTLWHWTTKGGIPNPAGRAAIERVTGIPASDWAQP